MISWSIVGGAMFSVLPVQVVVEVIAPASGQPVVAGLSMPRKDRVGPKWFLPRVGVDHNQG